MAKKIIIKIVLLLLIIAGINLLYNFTLYEKELNEKCEQIVEVKRKQANTDVFYFGESSNFNNRNDDSIKNAISEITAMFFPSLKLTTVQKPATHAGIYKYWIKQIDTKEKLPKAIIVTLNMRSFDAAWRNSKLETQLRETVVLAEPYPNIINRFLLSLQAYDNTSEQEREQKMLNEWEKKKLIFPFPVKYTTVREWDNGIAFGDYDKTKGPWPDEKIRLACHYVKGYAFNIDEKNPRIKDFDEIADWCCKNNINLYLNLMAENTEYADSLVGKELVFLMKQNRDFLIKRYNKNNCVVVDNLELVNGKEFTDQNWTTEHYGYKGRMIIAKNLAASLRKQFLKEYKNAY